MAAPTNTFTTYNAVGNREDLGDLIYTLKTDVTPFIDAIGRTTASATYHEWQTDILGSGDITNAYIEGNDFVGTPTVPTVRLGNRTQIMKKEPLVSGTQEAVSSAGKKSDMAYSKLKMMRQLKQDMETVMISNQTPVVGDGTTARKMRPVEGWYQTNANRGTGGAAGTATTAATDGTQRVLTEALLQDVLQRCFQAGGNPNLILVGAYNKRIISTTFNGGATKQVQVEDKTITAAVDVYESDYGRLVIKPDRHQRARTAHVLDTEFWHIAELRKLFSEPLGKTGDNTKEQMIWEGTLESNNEAASGVVADLTTA